MSNGVVFTNVDSFYSAGESVLEKEKVKPQANKKGIIKVLFIILIAFLIIEALVYTIIMPCLTPVKVTYSGLESLNATQISNYLEISPKLTWIQFDSLQAASKLASNAIIENVVIEKHFPDQVFVRIVERKAAAVTLANLNGKTVPVQIDKNGVIFAINKGMPVGNVPLITGLPFDTISEGMRINSKFRPLMKQVSEIQAKNPAYLSAISEIKVAAKEYGNYELELYPVHSHVKVLTDRTLNEEALKYMMVALDVIGCVASDVSVVDLRYGAVSYK